LQFFGLEPAKLRFFKVAVPKTEVLEQPQSSPLLIRYVWLTIRNPAAPALCLAVVPSGKTARHNPAWSFTCGETPPLVFALME
jgi:hypothetical protein